MSDLCGLIAAYIHLDAFIDSGFSNLRKSLARGCIDIFLAAGRTDEGWDITNDNGRLISAEGNRCGSRFRFSIVTDHTLHEGFLIPGLHIRTLPLHLFLYYTIAQRSFIEVLVKVVRGQFAHYPFRVSEAGCLQDAGDA